MKIRSYLGKKVGQREEFELSYCDVLTGIIEIQVYQLDHLYTNQPYFMHYKN